MSVEIRHLRAFVAVAEELNFTRAAERLFVAQQALSSQIRQLEDRLGTRLFERDTRSVSLTAAGVTLYGQAAKLLEDVDAVVESTRATSTSTTPLTVGFVVAIEHGYYARILNDFNDLHPDTSIKIHFSDTTDPSGGLRSRDVDVAFVYGPFNRQGLEKRFLFSEPLGVVMAKDHPLASVKDVSLEQVLDEPTFDFATADKQWRDYWMATKHRKGKPPRIVAEFHALDGLVAAIQAGLGVHTGTRALAEMGGPGLLWRPVADLEPLEHWIAWRSGDHRAVVSEFVEFAEKAFHKDSGPIPA